MQTNIIKKLISQALNMARKIIFDFFQVILEDRRTNRLMESRNIFDTIVNNRIFNNVSGKQIKNFFSDLEQFY